MDWEAIIWFIIWAVVILAGAGLILWAVIAGFAISTARAAKKDFDKGFESDFFKSARRGL
jgi:hypothetical protein